MAGDAVTHMCAARSADQLGLTANASKSLYSQEHAGPTTVGMIRSPRSESPRCSSKKVVKVYAERAAATPPI